MKTIRFFVIILIGVLANSCATLKAPSVAKYDSIEGYKYFVIPTTSNLTSSTGSVYGGDYGVYGATTTKSVNPGDVITGIMMKQGYTRLPEINPELINETLIINYGESGRRNIAGGLGGYTIEVTINLVSAKSHKTLASGSAEGQGSTEADDIRQAITRCLSAIFSK